MTKLDMVPLNRLSFRNTAYLSERKQSRIQNNSGTFKNWTELYLYNKIENDGLFWYGVDWQLCWNLHYIIFFTGIVWNPFEICFEIFYLFTFGKISGVSEW